MSLQKELGLPNPITHPGHETVMSLVLTGEILAKEGDRLLRAFSLTDSQFNILMLLKYQVEGGEINQTQLGRMLLVNRSNVTGLIDRMEKAGWVERSSEAGDRRVKRIKLTAVGRRLVERAEKVYFAEIEKIMAALTPDEARRLCAFTERLRERLHG